MSFMRATIISAMFLTAMFASGAGIYAATASDVYETTDGYGISSFRR
ncbi:hypothetical protein [Nitratireductor basaltis]|nr:hypothetical protein [Nitratireductor basaltis]